MDIVDNNWKAFVKSGSVNDYLKYRNGDSQNGVTQGVSNNAHQDGWDSNQRTEYR